MDSVHSCRVAVRQRRRARAVIVAVMAVAGLVVGPPARATNGYFLPGFGSRAQGQGGGGAALPEDSLAVVHNIAGLVDVPDGIDLGATVYSPWTTITVNGQSESTDLHWFPAPSFGIKHGLGDDLAAGFAVYGNGGIGNDYQRSPLDRAAGGGSPTGLPHTDRLSIRIGSLLALPSLAWRVNPQHAFGAGVLLSYQSFNAKGLGLFGCFTEAGSQDPACAAGGVPAREPDGLTNQGNGYQFGAGLRASWMWTVNPRLTFSLTGSTRIKSTRIKKYDALLPDGGNFDLPPMLHTALAVRATDRLAVMVDYQRVYYESVSAFGNRGPRLDRPPTHSELLGNSNGFGFGWKDQNIYRLGLRYVASPRWTWRTGFNYSPSQIAPSQMTFALLSPAFMERSVHVGLTHRLASGDEVSMAAFHGFKRELAGDTLLGPAKAQHDEYGVDFSYHWR